MKKLLKLLLFPQKIYNHLWNYVFLVFLSNSKIQAFPNINGRIHCSGRGKLIIGKDVKINSDATSNPVGLGFKTMFYIATDASILIGDRVGITNSLLFAIENIIIEDGVLIGGGCQIFDSDFHSLDPNIRNSGTDTNRITKKVLIKEKAFIGANCIILKGVTIGVNSVIAAGSIVSKDVPDNEIWGGNPAKFIKKLIIN